MRKNSSVREGRKEVRKEGRKEGGKEGKERKRKGLDSDSYFFDA